MKKVKIRGFLLWQKITLSAATFDLPTNGGVGEGLLETL
jgi:hypothetical protein